MSGHRHLPAVRSSVAWGWAEGKVGRRQLELLECLKVRRWCLRRPQNGHVTELRRISLTS